ncbi:unnamed protein product [Oppiella nova]|uniref:ribonuclease H n=1 Tax=Oppiella nova TaxID=334625 RepID=A0A7R9QR36_9ACAR|nr:unnamed protein product [Oppiella nova]CAG2172534.1 unnamed protein product [Oppiella nova]
MAYWVDRSGYGGSGGRPQPSDAFADRFHMYTSGACLDSGEPGARAGIGVFFPLSQQLNVCEPRVGLQTTNRAEIEAAIRGLQVAKHLGQYRVVVHTDSNFVIKSMTEWLHNWHQNGYKNMNGRDLLNKVDIQALEREMQAMDVLWNKVPGHRGIHGNDMAHLLANSGAHVY